MEEKFKFFTVLYKASIRKALFDNGHYKLDKSNIDAVLKELFNQLNYYGHRFHAVYSHGYLMDIELDNVFIDLTDWGFNIVLLTVTGHAPLMISINFDGKIYGGYQGWIGMDGDPDDK